MPVAEKQQKVQLKYARDPSWYPKQTAAIFDEHRYSLIEASTKSGKTIGCIVWLIEQALAGRDGYNYWWVAPILAQSRIAFDRMRRHLKPISSIIKINLSELSIEFVHGPKIWFKGADHPDSLYGEDVYAAVIDEASRVKEESWFAVRSTLTATQGPLRIIGNVKGRKNWFYRLARRAEQNTWAEAGYHKMTAADAVEAGVLSADEIEDARTVYPEAVFKELFYAEPSDDEGNPFGLKAIEACAVDGFSSAPTVVWGWDLARKHDFTVGIGLDAAGRVTRFIRMQKPWDEQIVIIRRETGQLPAYADATGVGDGIVGLIQRPMVAVEQAYVESAEDDLDEVEDKPNPVALQRLFSDTLIEGFMFNPKSKQNLMETLAVTIQQKLFLYPLGQADSGTTIPVDDPGHIKLELESYEYVYTRTGVRYSCPEGEFDDCVCAAALAVKCLQDKGVLVPADMNMGAWVEDMMGKSTWEEISKDLSAPKPEAQGVGANGKLADWELGGGGTWNLGF